MFYRGLVKPWIIIWFYRTCRISLCSISQSSQVLSNRVTKIANSTKKSQKYNQVYIKRNSRCLSFNLIKERYPVRGLRPWSDLENRVPRIQGPSNISRIFFLEKQVSVQFLLIHVDVSGEEISKISNRECDRLILSDFPTDRKMNYFHPFRIPVHTLFNPYLNLEFPKLHIWRILEKGVIHSRRVTDFSKIC